MIIVTINGIKEYRFYDPVKALRFMYMMKNRGYVITSYMCDDNEDRRFIERRIEI